MPEATPLAQDAGSSGANIWVAASDGDQARVQYIIEHEGMSPTSKDSSGYTPLHAAASRFLIEKFENTNNAVDVTDNDGDTPLFFAEKLDTAKLLVDDLGADPTHRNDAGLTAAENALVNDREDIAEFLASRTGETLASQAELLARIGEAPDDDDMDVAGTIEDNDARIDDAQVNAVMERVEEIMHRAEAEHFDPTEELRKVVSESIVRQIKEGYGQLK